MLDPKFARLYVNVCGQHFKEVLHTVVLISQYNYNDINITIEYLFIVMLITINNNKLEMILISQ